MKELIEWLEGVEQASADLYREAAVVFREDEALSAFLRQLSAEEAEHRQLIASAADLLPPRKPGEAPFVVDRKLRDEVDASLAGARQRLAADTLSRREMLEIVVDIEFSEYNEIFLYVIDVLREKEGERHRAAAEIDQHRTEIERFLLTLPEGGECLERLRRLPAVRERKILVVEDDPAVARLLESLLKGDGEIVIARNGQEGLARILEGHFDAIISDVSMPIMDGIAFYRSALEVDPDLKRRFVFFTASREDEHEAFFRSAGVLKLGKPAKLSLIRQTVSAVAQQTSVA